MKRFCTLFALATLASVSFAQSRSSFMPATITGVTSSLSGNALTTNVGATPTVTLNSTVYNITEVFGIWLLDDNNDLSASGSNSGVWSYNDNYAGMGGIAGWKTNPNTGLTPNQSVVLNYSSLTGNAESYGYHIRIDGMFQGSNTLFVSQPVPEPATLAVLGLGAAAMLRRRRK